MNTTDFFHKITGNWNYTVQFYFKNEYGEEIPVSYLYQKDKDMCKEKAIIFSKLNEHELII